MILARPFYFKLVVGNEAYRGKLICLINKAAEWDGERKYEYISACMLPKSSQKESLSETSQPN